MKMRESLPMENKCVEMRGVWNVQNISFVIFYYYFSEMSLVSVGTSQSTDSVVPTVALISIPLMLQWDFFCLFFFSQQSHLYVPEFQLKRQPTNIFLVHKDVTIHLNLL